MLEKDGDDQLDRLCEKLRSIKRVEEEGNILQSIKRRDANWVGHILRRGCLRKHPAE